MNLPCDPQRYDFEQFKLAPSTWKTEAQFYGWLRGKMRELWMRHPAKNTFKASVLSPIVNPKEQGFHPSTKKVGACSFCNELFPASKLEVDHIIPAGACRNPEEAVHFLFSMAFCSLDNMRLVCKPCHKVQTLAERKGISFKEAKAEKEAIAFGKLPVTDQKKRLRQMGVGQDAKNAKDRREAFKAALLSL